MIAVPSQRVARATLPPSARVRHKRDFQQIFDDSRRAADGCLSVHWRAGGTRARLGLAVSRRVDGRAVVRNRIKRRLRELFRRLPLRAGDCVVVARAGAATASQAVLEASLTRLLGKLGALPAPSATGTMPGPAPAPGATGVRVGSAES